MATIRLLFGEVIRPVVVRTAGDADGHAVGIVEVGGQAVLGRQNY